MSTAYIALGANLPFDKLPPADTLQVAVILLRMSGLETRARSSIWRSPAWPPSDQPDFYNAAIAVDARDRSPEELYEAMGQVEQKLGRIRREQWAARTIDLDLIAVDQLAGAFGGIQLPHPRMQERPFVLAPMAEIAPDWCHPALGQTASQLLAALPESAVQRVGPL